MRRTIGYGLLALAGIYCGCQAEAARSDLSGETQGADGGGSSEGVSSAARAEAGLGRTSPEANDNVGPGNGTTPVTQGGSQGGSQASASDGGLDAAVLDAAGAAEAAMVPPASCANTVPKLKLTKIASGFAAPVYVVSPPGDDRLFVVEQGGAIRILKGGQEEPTPFLDLRPLVKSGGEQGLLGMAFHPDFQRTGRFWVHYSGAGNGRTVVEEYKRSASNPDEAEPTPVKTLFTVQQPYPNHNGGTITFGPDGYLYIGLGDGGSANDPQGYALNKGSKLGKILRIDVDNYPAAPAGNLKGNGVDPHIWDYGLRNPWRFTFDRLTGDLYIGDVGQDAWEEINFEPKGLGNQNYGWNVFEGKVCRPGTGNCSLPGAREPVMVHDHGAAKSVTGGYVYRGEAIPCLRGRYIYGDFMFGRIFSFVMEGGKAVRAQELTQDLTQGVVPPGTPNLNIASFGEDRFGEMYLVNYGGEIFRLEQE